MPLMKDVVIVGAGHGAGQVVSTLVQKKYHGRITLIGDEPWHPYQRPPLSKKYLAGDMSAERLYLKPKSFYNPAVIDVKLDTRVIAIDPIAHSVTTSGDDTVPYNKLVLATGSRPRLLDVSGIDLEGIHYLRNIDDVDKIREGMSAGSKITIVGAGYIGLEVAAVAVSLGLNVSVIEMQDRVMGRTVSPKLSDFYQQVHRDHGVNLVLGAGVIAFVGDGQVEGVILSTGKTLPADIVVIGVGIVPNVELAEESGLETANGIVVDEHCRTSDSDIYAIGDCTFHPNALLGCNLRLESVHNALEQAKTAANNICGEDDAYSQIPWFWSDQYNLKLQIFGLSKGYDQIVVRGEPNQHSFAFLYLRDGVLISIDAVNRPRDFVQSRALIATGAKVAADKLADVNIQLKDLLL